MAFLELKNINYKYPTSEDWVVQNIDIKIEKGEFKSLENNEYQDINEFIETCMNRFAGRRPDSALIARKWFTEIN